MGAECRLVVHGSPASQVKPGYLHVPADVMWALPVFDLCPACPRHRML